MAKRIEYQIVGRYMSGKEVTGYHLQSIETGKSGRYTRDQVAFLVGRDQITNCTAQLYQDKVLLRGKGMSLDDLPVKYEDDGTGRENSTRTRKRESTAQAMEQFLIVGTIKSGRNTVGYVIQNAGCGIKKIKRQQVIELARAGKIGNARVQMYQGKPLLRGINCSLDELPVEQIGGETTAAPVAATVAPAPAAPAVETKQVRKTPTSKIILLDQFDYHPESRKLKVSLVTFAVHNSSMDKSELDSELSKFKQEAHKVIGHNFNNTEDTTEIDIAGKKCLGIYDNPYYSTIESYVKAAEKVNAKLVIDGNADIMNDDADLDAAHKDLAQLVKLIKSKDSNKTILWIPTKSRK